MSAIVKRGHFLVWVLVTCLVQAAQPQDRIRLVQEFHLMGGYITTLAWSPDGGQLAVGGMLGDVVLIDPTGERPDLVLARNFEDTGNLEKSVMAFCWSSDGKRVVVSSRSSLTLLDIDSGKRIAHRAGVTGPIVRVPGSTDFMCIGVDGDPQRIDGGTLERLSSIEMPQGGPAGLLAVSPDGERLAVSTTHTCELLVFELASGRPLRKFDHDPGAVHGLDWPENAAAPWWLAGRDLHVFGETRRYPGQEFIAVADGSRAAVLQADGWRILHPDGLVTPIRGGNGALALSPDGESWALATSGRLDIGRKGEVVRSIEGPVWFENIHWGQLSGDGRFVSLLNHRGELSSFSIATGDAVSVAGIPTGWFVPFLDGPELVWSTKTELSWWQLGPSGPPKRLRRVKHDFVLVPRAGHPELHGRWLTQSSQSVFDVRGELPSPVALLKGGAEFYPVAVGKTKWVAVTFGELRFFEDDGSTLVRATPLIDGFRDLAVSPDGSRVVVASWDERAQVVDVESGELVSHLGVVNDVRWLDDDTVISVSWRKNGAAASIWSADKGERLAQLELGQELSWLLDVSRKGKRALIGQSGVARVIAWE